MANDPKNPDHDPLDAAQFPVAGGVLKGEDPHANDPMTEAQAAELRQLAEKRGEPMDSTMTREQAAARIEALKQE